VWAAGPVWTGAENLASTGIRSPDRPARRTYSARFFKIFMAKDPTRFCGLDRGPRVEK